MPSCPLAYLLHPRQLGNGRWYARTPVLPTGALICIGSTLSDRGVPLQGAYCASKHALKGWLDSLRVELRHSGSKVHVTLVKPSSVNTPLFNKARTQLGVMPQPIPPVYDPDLAADVILRAAAGNERDASSAAGSFFRLRNGSLRRCSMCTCAQRVREPEHHMAQRTGAPSNLHQPVEHDGGVRGEFIRESRSRSGYQAVGPRAPAIGLVAGFLLAAFLARRYASPRVTS